MIIGEEYLLQRARGFREGRVGHFHQPLGEQGGWLVGQPERGGVGDFLQLPLDGGVNFWVIMPVQVRPDGGVRVEIFFALGIPQHRSLAASDNNRFPLHPFPHLGERMPDIAAIQLS